MIATLDGPRLQLRPLAEGDERLYRQLFGDPVVMERIAAPQTGEAAAQGFRLALAMNRASPAQRLFWVIQSLADGEAQGLIGLTMDAPGSAEVGVVLPQARQGRGLATEAITLLADHAFGPLALRRLHTRHASGHVLAAGLMRGLGFENTSQAEGARGWSWELTPARWAARPRRQGRANPLT